MARSENEFDSPAVNECVLKHLGEEKKKKLTGISEDARRYSCFSLQQCYTGLIQISWILYQNISNTSVNLTNISFYIYLCKVYLTASLEGPLSPSCFLFRQGANKKNCDLRTSRNKSIFTKKGKAGMVI